MFEVWWTVCWQHIKSKRELYIVGGSKASSTPTDSGNQSEGLGRLPQTIHSVSSLLLFNTSENPWVKGMTHAQESGTRNLHWTERTSNWCKFLVTESLKHNRPIKLHNLGHVHRCEFLVQVSSTRFLSVCHTHYAVVGWALTECLVIFRSRPPIRSDNPQLTIWAVYASYLYQFQKTFDCCEGDTWILLIVIFFVRQIVDF